MFVSAVIAAGGNSTRYGKNKLFCRIGEATVIEKTMSIFTGNDNINQIILVCNENDEEAMKGLFSNNKKIFIVTGGKTRTESVCNGLNHVSRHCDIVAIHDGARPFLSQELLNKLINEAAKNGSAVPYINSTDTMYLKNGFEKPVAINRDNVVCVQTPQIFDYRMLITAYTNFQGDSTDDSTVFYKYHKKLNLIEGDRKNSKITYPEDIHDINIGNGIDVHRLVENRDLILGGVKIPYEKGLLGHSDADVLIHAIMDSLLSAAGERDIGVQFPDTDLRYKDISSMSLLLRVAKILSDKRMIVTSISAVIVCQKPKLMDYIAQMKENIASVLHMNPINVNISVTTSEKLGMLGNGDGIAAQAVSIVSM